VVPIRTRTQVLARINRALGRKGGPIRTAGASLATLTRDERWADDARLIDWRHMLVLGVNADDKGAQLEALVRTILRGQGFEDVRLNVIRAGGNELDIVANLSTQVANSTHRTPLVGEAKAYATPINMPMWQRFLGKVFIERLSAPQTIGVMIALNGVNGNVYGSYRTLQEHSIMLLVGDDLIEHALSTSEISPMAVARENVKQQFRAEPIDLDIAYYGGAYRWVVRWSVDSYSVVDGHGHLLSSEALESLRGALLSEVSGELTATEEALALAEVLHDVHVETIGRLLSGEVVLTSAQGNEEIHQWLAQRPYCRLDHDRLTLIDPTDLDAQGVSSLFLDLFENKVSVRRLQFMVDGHHLPYLTRMIELLPDLQEGFALAAEDRAKLLSISAPFPSAWVAIARPNPLITVHRADETEAPDANVEASDLSAFWESVSGAIRADFSNPMLRGFLYDHLGVAEIEQATSYRYKSKTSVLGELEILVRDKIGRLEDGLAGEAGTRHLLIRALASAPEPWDHDHPEPLPLT